jgi:hypothetical protein
MDGQQRSFELLPSLFSGYIPFQFLRPRGLPVQLVVITLTPLCLHAVPLKE